MEPALCVACGRKCTISDSRPYPNATTKDRMHNRCLLRAKYKPNSVKLKTQTEDKPDDKDKQEPIVNEPKTELVTTLETGKHPVAESSQTIGLGKLVAEHTKTGLTSEEKVEKNKRSLEKILANERQKLSNDNQFFFDLKAGIAKPHEKRTFLYHKKLQDMKVSYDDNCFKADSVGRSFDHRGKDLNNPSSSSGSSNDESDESNDGHNSPSNKSQQRYKPDKNTSKRQKIESPTGHRNNSDRQTSDQRRNDHQRTDRNKQDNNQEPCWFCLSSPKVEKHLIIAIGDHCYLALAKGGLTDDNLLIVPIQHIRSTNDVDSQEMIQEINKFKSSLLKFFANQSKAVIFYERNFRSTHLQIQVVPIDLDMLDGIDLKIKNISEKIYPKISYQAIPNNCSISDMIPKGQSYFLWEIEPLGVKFYSKIDTRGAFFPMQFGRQILVHNDLLNIPHRIDWKKCSQSEEECKELVKRLKEAYKPLDFTLD